LALRAITLVVRLLHRIVTRVRSGHAIRGLACLGVDEISYCKGRRFATLVYDLD